MKRALIGVLAVAGAAAAADAFELRCRWAQRIANVDTPFPLTGVYFFPGEHVTLRLQFGLFPDASGPPPAGGFVGWNVGTLDATPDVAVMSAARLSPFTFAPPPGFGGTLDPLHLNNIDNTLGTQALAWNGVPGTNDPGQPPGATVRGANTFVSVFTLTFIATGNGFDGVAAGNAIAATAWNTITSTPPDPGPDGVFGTPDDTPGNVTYAPATLPPIPFSNCVFHVLYPPSPGAGTVLGLGVLIAGRRRRHSPARERGRRDS